MVRWTVTAGLEAVAAQKMAVEEEPREVLVLK